jgi:hypothetical protein
LAEANEIFGRPVLAKISPHTVDAAIVAQIGLLESGLAGNDIRACEQYLSVRRNDLRGLWRSMSVGDIGSIGQGSDRDHPDNKQNPFEMKTDAIVI